MHALRTSSTLIRAVLVWVLLTLGVAIASPVVQPRSLELVCAAGGATQWVALDEGGLANPAGAPHTLDCPACLPVALPLPALPAARPAALAAPGRALLPMDAPPRAALAGAPLPPRGPPAQV